MPRALPARRAGQLSAAPDRAAAVDDRCSSAPRRELLGSHDALIELVAAIATWRWISRVARSLDIPLEDGIGSWPPDGLADGIGSWPPDGLAGPGRHAGGLPGVPDPAPRLTDGMLDFSEIERVLVVMAHPDDVDFGAAGTVAKMTDAGIEVVYCLVTDGQAGGFDPTISRDEMASIRRQEQTKAGAEVGVTDLRFLGHMDGTVEASMRLREDISAVIRSVRPQVVITQSPIRDLDSTYHSHPDHTASAEAAMCAVYPDARNQFAFPGTSCADLEPWEVAEVWITFAGDRAQAVDITEQLERKIRALMMHRSQHRDPGGMEERVRTWWQEVARRHGLPEGSSAETFRVVDTR